MEVEARRSSVGRGRRLRTVLALGCAAGCVTAACGESPSAVERLEQATGPVVTVSGTIDIGSPPPAEEVPEIFLRFYASSDTTLLEERQLLWSGTYRLEFSHEAVCGWWMDVTIWDGRTSERRPVASPAPESCTGFLVGPAFWFP